MMKPLLVTWWILLFTSGLYAQGDFYSSRWSRVYSHELRDLPKSAIAIVDTIYRRAKAEKNIPQLTKALLYQSKFALVLEPDAELVVVRKFRNEIASASGPQRNILESMVARIYWDYFKSNRSKYYERTYTPEALKTEDFRLWDARTIKEEIDRHYQNSLKDPKTLQKFRLESIDEILAQGENSRLYRPTLYDLLAHIALDYYSMNEDAIYNFNSVPIKDTTYFNEDWRIIGNQSDSSSHKGRLLKLYQSLLAFHKTTRDTTAYIDMEIDRINYIAKAGDFGDAIDLKLKSFRKLSSKYSHHPASAAIDYEIATILDLLGQSYSKSDKTHQFKRAQALELCNKTIDRFPGTPGAERCISLRNAIRSSEISITTESAVPVNLPFIARVEFRNVGKVTVTAYKIDESFYERYLKIPKDSALMEEIRSLVPQSETTVDLNAPKDYQTHDTEFKLPPLPSGRYLLFVRATDDDRVLLPGFRYETVQVSNFAVLETHYRDRYRLHVMDRVTGRPLRNVRVRLKSKDKPSTPGFDREFVTNEEGYFDVDRMPDYHIVNAFVGYRDDSYVAADIYLYKYDREPNKDHYDVRAILFTDRSIYRPGQTVHFKGILLKVQDGRSSLVTGEYVEVSLQDVNYEEVSTLRVKSNSFGSFSGEFKLPQSGLTGKYIISVDEDFEDDSKFYDNSNGFVSSTIAISVEEYKRPTFEVTFNPVQEAYIVGDTIRVTGTATAFNGAKITNADVKYHVKRTTLYRYWVNRDSWPLNSEDLIDTVAVTNSKGEFVVKFVAQAQPKTSKEGLPIFTYEITADVTDINGETRTGGTQVKAGFHALAADLSIPPEVNRNVRSHKIGIKTENLNGQFLPAKGTVKIHKLESPRTPVRQRPWAAPEYYLIGEQDFRRDFPYEACGDEADPKAWKNGKVYAEFSFDTEKSREIQLSTDKTWPIGRYAIELNTTDAKGMIITDHDEFTIVDPGSTQVADNQLLIFETDKPSYKPGETMKVRVGSAANETTFLISIENDGGVIESRTERFTGTAHTMEFVVPSSAEGELRLSCSGVAYNSFIQSIKQIPVISTKRLDIETISFRDKLKPGGKELWSFEIKNEHDDRKEAEVLASMYDASLDVFRKHSWEFSLDRRYRGYGQTSYTSAGWSFHVQDFRAYRPIRTLPRTFPQQYDQFDWFGFSINPNEYVKRLYRERIYADPTRVKPSKVSMRNSRHRPVGFVFGTITAAAEGVPIPGVNIWIKGTQLGTISDVKGEYEIEVNKGDTLQFSFVGYVTAEAIAGNKNTINVALEEDVKGLMEVVVVGYGMQARSELSGSVAVVAHSNQEDYVIYERLQGRSEGVTLNFTTGGVGRIDVRGTSSLQPGKALYVVDGVPVTSYTIEEDDLASINIVKGDAAVAIYGSRAVNGVIVITTKSGQARLDAEMGKVNARTNFNETAFFLPHLTTDENGKIRFSFTTPEWLTRWKLQLFAHNRSLLTGSQTLLAVTQKDLMVTPNMPRFVRAGDEIILSAKIANLTPKSSQGNATLQLIDPITGNSIDTRLNNLVRNKAFKMAPNGNTEVSWSLKVPEGIDAIQYRVVAKAGKFSDGEQSVLPVLSDRVMITETVPLYVRQGQSKDFSLSNLVNLKSTTLTHHRLTFEVTSNPAWYALQALPYLMEFPHECAEQLFSRYYANTLGNFIVKQNPKLQNVFEKWKADGALTSDLETNPDLKSILIEETPWLRDALNESEQKKRVALLFDTYATKTQIDAITAKLTAMQFSNGGFPWFAGGSQPNRYITQHIASSYGHLLKLKAVTREPDLIKKAVAFLDHELIRDYETAMKFPARSVRYSNEQVQYLYMRSFFPDLPIDSKLKTAIDYYISETQQDWQNLTLYFKTMVALVHHRRGNNTLAMDILRSIKENSINDDELGMYWKENKPGLYWHESPVETQALIIEAFEEISSLTEDVDAMRVWLLKNKQTTQWKTTKATTEAVYALLLRGTNWTSDESPVQVSIASKELRVSPTEMEAGTGTFKKTWGPNEIVPEMGNVSLTRENAGVAWGGLYWQHFEKIDNVVPSTTPLKLEKKVFVVTRKEGGETMNEVNDTTTLKPGDLLRVRIRLSVDRNMDFLHMKDQRASGTEPVDVLSQYRWQDGLGYYQSTMDAATHFFFDRINTGVYVFEYDLRVNNKGRFSNGIATIESMYAPEFTSHSTSVQITVK